MPSPPVNDTAAVTKVEAAPKSKFSADLLLKIGLVLVLIGAGLVIYRRRAARQPLTTWDESANVTKLSQTKPGF